MDTRRIVDILNDLLAMETGSCVARVREAGHYVSWPAAGKMGALREMIEEDSAHERWLVDEMQRLAGSPRPRALGIQTAGSHYLDAEYLIPTIIDEERRLVAAYRRAQSMVPADASTTLLMLAGILARHEAHANRLAETASATPGAAPRI
jgi:bacterioferritin (cytochrome b1)